MKYKAIIIDDEPGNRTLLQKRIADWLPQIEVMTTYATPAEAIDGIAAHKPDILFLDIRMPQMNGFELYSHLTMHNIHAQCIIVTAYPEHDYYVKAINMKVAGYVLKPIMREHLKEAVDAAIARIRSSTNDAQKQIAFDTTKGMLYVSPAQILYIHSSAKYCEAFLTTGAKEIVMNGISELEQLLFNTSLIRIDRYTILNKQYILNITDRGNKVQFHTPAGNAEIEITKEGIDRLKKLLRG